MLLKRLLVGFLPEKVTGPVHAQIDAGCPKKVIHEPAFMKLTPRQLGDSVGGVCHFENDCYYYISAIRKPTWLSGGRN